MSPTYLMGISWLPPVMLFWQVRFYYLAPLAFLCAAVDCVLTLPYSCARYYPDEAVSACVGVNVLRVLLLVLLVPLSCCYLIEGHARRLYAGRDRWST